MPRHNRMDDIELNNTVKEHVVGMIAFRERKKVIEDLKEKVKLARIQAKKEWGMVKNQGQKKN